MEKQHGCHFKKPWDTLEDSTHISSKLTNYIGLANSNTVCVEITYVAQCFHSGHPPGPLVSETGCTGSPQETALRHTADDISVETLQVNTR